MGKKNDNVYQLIAIVLMVVGFMGAIYFAGYYLWFSAIGSIILIIKRKTQPAIIGNILTFVGIIVLLYFAFMLFKSLIP